MQHDHVAAPRLDAVENVAKVIQIEVIADRHKDVPGRAPTASGLSSPSNSRLN